MIHVAAAAAAPHELLGISSGGWLVAITAVIGAVATVLAMRISRTTREATSMATAWDRIERLEKDHDTIRRALRILEEGFDALWSWRQRVPNRPAMTDDEDRAVRRARRSLEIADTGPTPVQR